MTVGTDSSAAKSFASRRGLGKNRHIMTKYLRFQDRVSAKDLGVAKLNTKHNRGDIFTKPLGAKERDRLLEEMHFEYRNDKSKLQRTSIG